MRARVDSMPVVYVDRYGNEQEGDFKLEPWSDEELRKLDVDMSRAAQANDIIRSEMSDVAAFHALRMLSLEHSLEDNQQTYLHVIDLSIRLQAIASFQGNEDARDLKIFNVQQGHTYKNKS
jgi:hypothetical protein